MKTPLTARLVALVASTLIALGTVDLIANYALPDAPPVLLAAAPR